LLKLIRFQGFARMTLPDGYIDVPPGKIAAVVTHLEMLERPRLRPALALPQMVVRRVPSPAVAWYRDLYRRVGAEDWLWFSRLGMPEQALMALIGDPKVEIFALTLDGRDEGLLELDFRVDAECELAFFGLTQRLLGRGAGRLLMNAAIEHAWSHPILRFWVHTCTLDHPGALAFYVRTGFRPFRRQIEIANDPRLSGLLPETAAPHVPIIR
jgi:GNAT superfamily N-acetyltransferase